VVDRFVDVPARKDAAGTGVRAALELQRLVVADEPVVVVRRPGNLVVPAATARVDPAERERVVADLRFSDQPRQRLDQGYGGNLVAVEPEDPVAGALLVQPGEIRLEEADLSPRHLVRNGAVLGDVRLVHGGIRRDHDLVRHRAERLEDRPDPISRRVGQAANGERRH
jgi:hypothetical protein